MTASELPTRCTPLTERSPDGALYWRGPLPKGRSTEEVFQRRGALLTERSIDGALRKAPTKRSIDGALTLPTKPSTDVALCGRGTLLAKYPVYRRRTLVMGNSPDGALYGRSTLPTEHSLPTKLRSLSTNKALYWQVLALPTELSTNGILGRRSVLSLTAAAAAATLYRRSVLYHSHRRCCNVCPPTPCPLHLEKHRITSYVPCSQRKGEASIAPENK